MHKWVQAICIVVMVFCAVKVVHYGLDYVRIDRELETIQQRAVNEEFKALQQINSSIVGWLSLDGTRLNNPVLQADNNNFYLAHNYLDEPSRGGSVFLDFRNYQLSGRHTIFYGHVLRNGTMFGELAEFADQQYAQEHPVFTYETEQAVYKLQVFSAYETTTDFYYIETEFTDETFGDFLKEITERSVIDLPVDVAVTDHLVTFSTCTTSINDKERFVVHAKLVQIETRGD